MSHVRKQIRDAVATAITSLGGVHASRLYPVQPDELPVFLIYGGNEEIAGDFQTLERRFQVIVEIIADGQGFDDALDDHLVSVEELLAGNLGGLVVSFMPATIELSASVEGSTPIGRARITYEAVYRTSYTDVETSI